jgi:MFS family permease
MAEKLNEEKKILMWGKYEFTVLWWFFLVWGLIFLDRLVVPFTAPLVIADLGVTEVQYGLINTVTTGAFALSAIFISGLLEATGKRKIWLILLCLGAGICVCLGALTQNVWQFLIVRAFVGFFEGPISPIIVAILLRESSSKRVAINMGILNMGVSAIAIAIGPIVVTQIAEVSNWRNSFLVAGGITLIATLIMVKFVKEKPFTPEGNKVSMFTTLKALFKYRNVVLSAIIGIVTMVCYWTLMLYATRFFVEVAQHPLTNAGYIIAIMGTTGIVMTLIVPKVSDWMGRKNAVIMWFLLYAIMPFVMFNAQTSVAAIVMYAILGALPGSIVPYFQSIIPSETIPNYMLGTASGLIMGLAEIFGGSLWPAAAGFIAGEKGIPTVILIAGFAAIIAAILCFFLKETKGQKDVVQDAIV